MEFRRGLFRSAGAARAIAARRATCFARDLRSCRERLARCWQGRAQGALLQPHWESDAPSPACGERAGVRGSAVSAVKPFPGRTKKGRQIAGPWSPHTAPGPSTKPRLQNTYLRSEEHTSELQSLLRHSYAVLR